MNGKYFKRLIDNDLFMYPFSFAEFMSSCDEERLWSLICQSSPENPLHPVFHERALEILKQFLVIGGMPAVVAKFIDSRNFVVPVFFKLYSFCKKN